MDAILKAWGICGETPFAELDLTDPNRKQAARRVVAEGTHKPHSRCPTCQSPRRKLHRYVGVDGPCTDTWHPGLP